MSARAIAKPIVKVFEGFHRVTQRRPVVLAVPYVCPAGYWTQAWGHLCKPDAPPCTEEQGEVWLDGDLGVAEYAVHRYVNCANLTDAQIAALIDWTLNLGGGRLKGSTLRAVINRGELDRAPAEFRKWVFGGGVKLPGLVARREAEVEMWLR